MPLLLGEIDESSKLATHHHFKISIPFLIHHQLVYFLWLADTVLYHQEEKKKRNIKKRSVLSSFSNIAINIPRPSFVTAIISKVKRGLTVNGSLYRPDLNKIVDMPFGSDEAVRQAMQDSWAEDPMARPTFRQLKVKLKGMKEKGWVSTDIKIGMLEWQFWIQLMLDTLDI